MFDFDELDDQDQAETANASASSPARRARCYRHRWAFNIDDWTPVGEENGAEFQYLLGLIREDVDRGQVMKYKFLADKKRALISRLLIRQASASALGHTSFRELMMHRTKGKKPFLATPLTDEAVAPNWNVNVSHEGSWVVCASEPLCVVGIDVAELRRLKPNGGPIDFYKVFKEHLTALEWNDVRSGGPSLDEQYEVFSRYWSAKEAFTKARGDGIAFPLGQAEFHWTPLQGSAEKVAYQGLVTINGKAAPLWRFLQCKMPGVKAHWTTVARGPTADVVDANGEFSETLRRPSEKFAPEAWECALADENPAFEVIQVVALVPKNDLDAYKAVAGAA